jgi:hypothetical protein
MNKNPLVFLTPFTRLSSPRFHSHNLLVFLLISMTFVLGSCNDDDEDFSADVEKVVGTYSVTDTDEDDEVENYTVTISKSGNGVEITNFGDIMYVPVKATIKGNVFTIPSQTFKGKTMTIVIYGQGILNGDQLTFDYTIDTGDDFLLEHTCNATKQE